MLIFQSNNNTISLQQAVKQQLPASPSTGGNVGPDGITTVSINQQNTVRANTQDQNSGHMQTPNANLASHQTSNQLKPKGNVKLSILTRRGLPLGARAFPILETIKISSFSANAHQGLRQLFLTVFWDLCALARNIR